MNERVFNGAYYCIVLRQALAAAFNQMANQALKGAQIALASPFLAILAQYGHTAVKAARGADIKPGLKNQFICPLQPISAHQPREFAAHATNCDNPLCPTGNSANQGTNAVSFDSSLDTRRMNGTS